MNKFKQLNSFSISDLQQFSGIKAHTIRMWEQRYNTLKPFRSDGNTRYYNGDQLRRLLNIVSLVNAGYKISQLGPMQDEKLFNLIDKHLAKPVESPAHEYLVLQLIAAATNYDEPYFDKIFSNSVLRFGLRESYVKLFCPLLERLGLLWAEDILHPAQEHFITNLLRQKILSAIDALPPPATAKNTWLLFLPENEFHDLGLLLASFLIRQAGKKVIYLGENMPFDSLEAAVAQIKPSYLLTFMTRKNNLEEDHRLSGLLRKYLPGSKIYVACDKSRLINTRNKNLVKLHSVNDLENEIKKTV